MRVIVDAQLPPVLADWIAEQGHVADHVYRLQLVGMSDAEIWAAALIRQAAVVTKDRDFVDWAYSRLPAPQVVWLRLGNISNEALMARVQAVWSRVVADLESGARVVEIGNP